MLQQEEMLLGFRENIQFIGNASVSSAKALLDEKIERFHCIKEKKNVQLLLQL